MRPLVQDVLIGFVTTSDPGSDRGPANIITVAKAKLPQVIYLLYTDTTQANCKALLEWLKHDPELSRMTVQECKLDLPDVTNYEKLATLLPQEVKKISKQHPGAHFHLVSGLAQARIIFALCLHARLLTGTLWEVNPLEPPVLRPYTPPPQKLDKLACERRLKRWPTAIFDAFRNMLLERYKAIRLRIDLRTEQAWLDDRLLGLRASAQPRSERGLISVITFEEGRDVRPRTFQTLVLLAAKKRYGLGNDRVTKSLILQTAYSDQKKTHAAVNIRRALDSINRQARRITALTGRAPLDPLILDVKRGGQGIGIYRLTDKLNPPDETIEFVGNVQDYLQRMGISLHELPSLFPDLPSPLAYTR